MTTRQTAAQKKAAETKAAKQAELDALEAQETASESPQTAENAEPIAETPEAENAPQNEAEEAEAEAEAEKVEAALSKEHGSDKFATMKKGILDLADNGASKAKIEGFLCYAHDLSTTEAKTLIAHVIGKGRTGIGNLAQVVQLTRKRFNDSMTTDQKKSLVAELVKLSGSKESAIVRMLSQIPFAREWSRQENGATDNG